MSKTNRCRFASNLFLLLVGASQGTVAWTSVAAAEVAGLAVDDAASGLLTVTAARESKT